MSSSTTNTPSVIDQLYDRKFQTIKEEIKLTEKLNSTIKNGGLSKSSKLAIQNLKDAIASSNTPFYKESIGNGFHN